MASGRATLRRKILIFVATLATLFLIGSSTSLYRIGELSQSLDAINRVSVPLEKLISQLESDADLFQKELNRKLGYRHWGDKHWKPQPLSPWIRDILNNEIRKTKSLIAQNRDSISKKENQKLQEWILKVERDFNRLQKTTTELYTALEQKDHEKALQIYPGWFKSQREWIQNLGWGGAESKRILHGAFTRAENRVSSLKTGLGIVLITIITLSLYVLWLAERALKPLGEMANLARAITERGLKKEDKSKLPRLSVVQADEVSQLSREFHRMATALLEREKTVEEQKKRLEEKNRLLGQVGLLNEDILKSIDSILIVADLDGVITHVNPVAAKWLSPEGQSVLGTKIENWSLLEKFFESEIKSKINLKMQSLSSTYRLPRRKIGEQTFGGHLVPLRDFKKDPEASSKGIIILLEDLTEQVLFENRLRLAENLAAVGRMSAQVAHEVRNPLHSIGLEAEIALERSLSVREPGLKQSIQSILNSVDRLENITENYLKLSKISSGEKRQVNLRETLETVLATYSAVCEKEKIAVDWKFESSAQLGVFGDAALLEQVFGNLMRNAIQALEESVILNPRILWEIGNTESGKVWVRVRDNGLGVSSEIKEKLFTPFVTTKAHGTGLGLSFIKRVVEEHGGDISYIESSAGSDGAIFQVILPISKEEFEKKDVYAQSIAGR